MGTRVLEEVLDLPNVCDGNTYKLITAHASAIGVPQEYIFFPLLSSTAAILGNSRVEINQEWHERFTLWCAILGKQGSRRSTALWRFTDAITESEASKKVTVVHDKLTTQNQQDGDDKSKQVKSYSVYCDDVVDFMAGILEPVGSTSSDIGGVNGMKKLYDSNGMKEANSLNLTGFVLPAQAVPLLQNQHPDLSSRLLVSCPHSVMYKSKDFKIPMPKNTPDLTKVFNIINHYHSSSVIYKLTSEAQTIFYDHYDGMMGKMMESGEDSIRACIWSQAPGQLARLSGILAILRRAVKMVVYKEDTTTTQWVTEITPEDIETAKTVMNYVIKTKIAILDGGNNHLVADPNMTRDENLATLASVASLKSIYSPARTAKSGAPPAKRQRIAAEVKLSHSNMKEDDQRIQMANLAQLQRQQQMMGSVIGADISMDSNISLSSPLIAQNVIGEMAEVHRPDADGTGVSVKVTNITPDENGGASSSGGNEDWGPTTPPDSGILTNDLNLFCVQYSGRIKKLLEYPLDWRITPSVVAQRHLMPALSHEIMARMNTVTRYPAQLAKEFLSRVAKLGFGSIESDGNTPSRRKSSYFQKLPYDRLAESTKKMLRELQVEIDDYMAAFMPHSTHTRSGESSSQVHMASNPAIAGSLSNDGLGTVTIIQDDSNGSNDRLSDSGGMKMEPR